MNTYRITYWRPTPGDLCRATYQAEHMTELCQTAPELKEEESGKCYIIRIEVMPKAQN